MVLAPLAKSVSAAVTVQDALSRARLSVTVQGPIAPEMLVPGAPLPRLALAGTLSESAPEVTVNVSVVDGSPGAAAGPPAAVVDTASPPAMAAEPCVTSAWAVPKEARPRTAPVDSMRASV